MAKLICALIFSCAVFYTYNVHAIPSLSRNEVINTSSALIEATPNNDYITSDIGRHKIHTYRRSWNDARNTCLDERAHLAVIDSAAEEAFLRHQMIDKRLDELWIGMHELFHRDQWISVKDQRLDAIGYVHWGRGQPTSMSNNQHCLALGIAENGLNDRICDRRNFFVCEK